MERTDSKLSNYAHLGAALGLVLELRCEGCVGGEFSLDSEKKALSVGGNLDPWFVVRLGRSVVPPSEQRSRMGVP